MKFTRKSAAMAEADASEPGSRLRSELNRVELVAIGLAVMVGAGIFVSAPEVFVGFAGPVVVWAFAAAAALCVPVALCYAACSSRLPVAGGAYTFAYVAFSRPVAYVVGWLLVMEYTVGAAVVAKGWSGYLRELLAGGPAPDPHPDWAAAAVVALLALVLFTGVRTTSRVALVATAIKVGVLLLVVAVGVPLLQATNLGLHAEGNAGAVAPDPPSFGVVLSALLAGVGVLFYAFIGFDSISTVAEESRRPRRDLPQAILGALGIGTALYLAVALVMAGRYPEAVAPEHIRAKGQKLTTIFAGETGGLLFRVVSIGAVVGLTTGILVLMLAQSRIAFAMARDGFLPRGLAKLGWRRNPQQLVLFTGAASAVITAFGDTTVLEPVVNLGTLLVFAMVCCAAWTLQRRGPEPVAGTFRVAGVPVIAPVGIVLSLVLAVFVVVDTLPDPDATDGLVWFGIGTGLYVAVGFFLRTSGGRQHWRSRLPEGVILWIDWLTPWWRYPRPCRTEPVTTSPDGRPAALAALVADQQVVPVHRLSGLLAPGLLRRVRVAFNSVEERAVEGLAVIAVDVVLLDPHLVHLGMCGERVPDEVDEITAGRILAVSAVTAEAMRASARGGPRARRRQVDRILRRVLVLPAGDPVSKAYAQLGPRLRADRDPHRPQRGAGFVWTAAPAIDRGLPVAVADPVLRDSWRPYLTLIPDRPRPPSGTRPITEVAR